MDSGRPSVDDATPAAAAAPTAPLPIDGPFFLVRMIFFFFAPRTLGVGLASLPAPVSFLINAGLGTVPSGSIVSSTPCLMRPCSWKLGIRTRSGSIQLSMKRLDLSIEAVRVAEDAAALLLVLALALSFSAALPRLLPSIRALIPPATPPPTAGLEYREREARVVGGADMVSGDLGRVVAVASLSEIWAARASRQESYHCGQRVFDCVA